MCALVARTFGFEPREVEEEMGFPEVQFRFVDALKITRRQQGVLATSIIGAVGAFFVKSGEKTMLEEWDADIEKLSQALGDIPEQDSGHAESEARSKAQLEDWRHAQVLREMLASRKANHTRTTIGGI